MSLTTFTQQMTGPGGNAGDPIDLRDGNGLLMRVVNVVGDSSYTVGGSPLTPQQLGFPNGVVFAQAELLSAPTSGTTNNASSGATIVATNGGTTLALKCFTNGSGAASVNSVECAAAANLSGLTWQIIAWGW